MARPTRYSPKLENGQSGWSESTGRSIRRSGRRSPRSCDARARRFGAGSARRSVTGPCRILPRVGSGWQKTSREPLARLSAPMRTLIYKRTHEGDS